MDRDEMRHQRHGSERFGSRERNAAGLSRWLVITAIAVVVAAVALAVFLVRGSSGGNEGRRVPAPTFDPSSAPTAGSAATSARAGDVVVTLSADSLANAGIQTEIAAAQTGAEMAAGVRTTGTVQQNAYKEVPVMSIAGGIVRQVSAQLGDRVTRGQALATIFSTDLADAQTGYLRVLAEVEEHHLHHNRTIELAELGAASREELEQATSEYKSAQASLASWRERLSLLGMRAKQVEELRSVDQVKPLILVEAPASGTILSRTVNTGEVVMANKELFRVADLSTVWVIGQIFEVDFAAVREGTPAAITTFAYPRRVFRGRASYIAPRVEPQTRTAEVRVEVDNPGGMLRLGMFVDVSFGAAQPSRPVVGLPRAAVQSIGEKKVVYLATGQPGAFVQREVEAGAESAGVVPIYSGVDAGDRVATEGSFLLRAESLKLKPEQLIAATAETRAHPATATPAEPEVQSVTVLVTENGFEPASFKLKRGVAARLTFIRKVEVTCATEVSIPEFSIRRALPLNERVVVEFTPDKAGKIPFTCGMGMQRGKIIVK